MNALSTRTVLAATTAVVAVAAGVLAATAGPPPGATPPGAAPPAAAKAEPPRPGPAEAPARPVHSLLGHTDRLTSVAFSPDGRWVGTAAWDGTARIWDAATGKEVRRLEFPATQGYNSFGRILFSPDSAFVVTAVRESQDAWVVVIWDRQTGDRVRTIPTEIGSVALSPDGRLIACGGYRLIGLYELATGRLVRTIHGDEKQTRIESLAFTPDGRSLLSTGHPPTPQPREGVTRLTIMPDALRVWDVASGTERPSPLNGLVVGLGRHGSFVVLSADGRTLVHPSGNDMLLRETATGKERARLTGHKHEVCDFAFRPDGRTLASGSMDGTVRLWDLPSRKELGCFGAEVDPFKGGWILSVAFSPDGRTLASGGLDKTARIWDVSRITGRPRAAAERTAVELEADWTALAGDAAAGYAAVGRLAASPGSAVPFLGRRLEAAAAADTGPTDRLIAALGDAQVDVRERATKALGEMGDRAVPSLRNALAATPSPDVRQKLGDLLTRATSAGPSAETVREVRAVESLEAIGTAEARRVLQTIAAGPPGTRLTEEAKASADRLAGRSGAPPEPR
jgi:dipeptidyl aminopeptidase/acylaminoacyl peptidase